MTASVIRQSNYNEIISFLRGDGTFSFSESNPNEPENLYEYIDWNFIKNEESGLEIWKKSEIVKISSKSIL